MRSSGLFTILLAVSLLGACNSQDATVTSADSAGKGPTADPSIQRQRAAQDATKLTNATVKRSVFFSMIRTDYQGTPTQTSGVAFLANSSQSNQAFSFHIDNGDIPYNSQVFTPTSGGILFAWRSGTRDSDLGLFDPRTRLTSTAGTVAGTRIARLDSPDPSTWAWTGRDGNAWVAIGDPTQGTKLPLNGIFATNIQVNSQSRDVLVSGTANGASSILVFTLDNLVTPKLHFDGQGAVESSDGTKIAYLQDAPTGTKIAIHDVASNTTSIIDSHGITRGLRWRVAQQALTYRLLTSDGRMTLRQLDTTTGTDTALVPLHLADAQTADDNIVCPSWDGENRFYFADLQNSKYSIYRATRVGLVWRVALFASPSTEMTGFICPQLLSSPSTPGSGS